jgi:hypothetical protein
MPGTSPSSEDSVPPRQRASAKYENLTPFEAALIDMHGEGNAALLGEFQGLRKDIGWMFKAGGLGTFTLIAFLIAGVMILKGIDPGQAANATRTVVESTGVTTTVETKKTEPEVGGAEP